MRRVSGWPRRCRAKELPQHASRIRLFCPVRRLANQGVGVVLISHNMVDVLEVADRICALYLGRVAAEVKASEVTHSQVVELITAGRSGSIGLAPAEAAQSM